MSKYIKIEDIKTALIELNNSGKWLERETTTNIIKALDNLPAIEVSEDAISRAEALKAYNEAVEELVEAEMEEFNLGDFTECKFDTTQLKLIARKIWDAPSVTTEQSSKVGEWVESEIPNELYVCSECGGACWSYDWDRTIVKSYYCPNCGCRMKG